MGAPAPTEQRDSSRKPASLATARRQVTSAVAPSAVMAARPMTKTRRFLGAFIRRIWGSARRATAGRLTGQATMDAAECPAATRFYRTLSVRPARLACGGEGGD